MTQYYFTAASLPHLSYDMDKFPAIEDFLEICGKYLTKNDFKLLKEASYDDLEDIYTNNKILNNWFNWERHLRNRLVMLRAKKKHEAPEAFIRKNPELFIDDKFIQQAFEEESPLEAENILDKARWAYLETMELGHYFDVIKLVVYYLKLQILWRRHYIDKERGIQKFNVLIDSFNSENIFLDNIE